jgi:hypothetical protein
LSSLTSCLCAGGPPDLIIEPDRLVGTLLAKADGADLAGDTARFMAAFENIYLGGAE